MTLMRKPPMLGGALARIGLSLLSLTFARPVFAQTAPPSATATAPAPGAIPPCPASPAWVAKPSPPQEIPGGGANFCQFYQFAWQWFLYLVSPSKQDRSLRNFEVQATFPQLQGSGNSCTKKPATRTLFVRTVKEADPFGKTTMPKDIAQAGGGATIYDQSGSVVYYEVRFSRNECATPDGGNFAPGTTELKTAWRPVTTAEAPRYYTIKTTIEGVSTTPVLLGLVGFHLARNTAQHPEFVWASWEHKDNAPDCLAPQAPPATGWSFASGACAQCLKTSSTGPLGCKTCDFNAAKPSSGITGTPTQICRVYRDGSAPGDNKVDENLADVDTLNAQLVGPGGIVSKLPPGHPLSVWQNYFNVGGLWVSDPKQAATAANQRGSLQLASSVMETTHQGAFSAAAGGKVQRGPALNCFVCHTYTPPQPTTKMGLSHIFDEIKGAKAKSK